MKHAIYAIQVLRRYLFSELDNGLRKIAIFCISFYLQYTKVVAICGFIKKNLFGQCKACKTGYMWVKICE